MLDKNVCPKCGQLYAVDLTQCPLCGAAAPHSENAPVRRERISDEERRRRMEQRRREEHKKKKEKYDAEERYLQQQEEKARRARMRARMERNGTTEEEERTRIPAGYLVVSVLLLLAALLIGSTYLLWRSGAVDSSFYQNLAGESQTTEPVQTEAKSTLTLNAQTLSFAGVGETQQLTATLTPADAQSVISYQSSAPQIATVDVNGLVTALAAGEAEITVSCGSAKATCSVSVAAAETEYDPGVPLELNYEDITFFSAGEYVMMKVKNVEAGTQIVWSSEDESVAKVDENGKVEAVGEGTVDITATIGESTGKCIVRCNFD